MDTHQKKVLVTGSKGGLGRYCLEHFNAHGFSRDSSLDIIKKLADEVPYDAIIHAAYNTKQNITDANLASYLQDTLFLTQQLLQIPHEKFIFISTVDIYPKNLTLHTEDESIAVKDIDSIYGLSKLMCESFLKDNSHNYLILRPTALLGPYAKKNSLLRLLTDTDVQLSLASTSSFNYVLHKDICDFIDIALKQDLKGTYNFAVSDNISLDEVLAAFKPNGPIKFGNYCYQVGNICNKKIKAVFPSLNRPSLSSIKLFQQSYGLELCKNG